MAEDLEIYSTRLIPLYSIFNDTVSDLLMKDFWVEGTLPDSKGMSNDTLSGLGQ